MHFRKPQLENWWRHELGGIAVDIAMLLLISVNLTLIVFDWLFSTHVVQHLLNYLTPSFFVFYRDRVHPHFTSYDLIFVTIYVIEFCLHWLVCIWRGTYYRWFFFPFVHWYDLLGCIPVGSFRWLRVLRLYNILKRLQRMGVIDLRDTYAFAVVAKYYHVLVEEISDRVVINVLTGAQNEVRQGSPILQNVKQEVLLPRKEALLSLASEHLAASVSHAHQHYREPLGDYLTRLTDELLRQSPASRRLVQLPVAGPQIQTLVHDLVKDLGINLVDRLVADLSDRENRPRINRLLATFIEADTGIQTPLTPLLQEVIDGILEQVKAQVAVQQWKVLQQ